MYLAQAKEMAFIKTIILVSSLSGDTYTGNAGSDIDLIHIVSDKHDYVWEKEQIFGLIDKIEEKPDMQFPLPASFIKINICSAPIITISRSLWKTKT